MFQIAEFARQQIQTARAPKVLRSLRVLEQRVSALDDAVRYHAMEGASVVVALPRKTDELIHMFRRLVGRKFETKRSEIGGDNGFQIDWRLRPRRRLRKDERQE